MKKTFFVSLCFIFFFSVAFAYQPTVEDKKIVLQFSTKIEKLIQNKWESKRQVLVAALEKITLKYAANEKIFYILDATLQKIRTNSEIIQKTVRDESVEEYVDGELWISFLYPKSWGSIKKEYDVSWAEWIDFVILIVWEKVLFGFANWKPSVGRWGFWWDGARSIVNLQYIENICNKKNIDTSKWESCEIKKNSNGIVYARSIQEYREMWEDTWRLVVFYDIYNTNSDFRGIVASNERFNVENTEQFDAIIESINFL